MTSRNFPAIDRLQLSHLLPRFVGGAIKKSGLRRYIVKAAGTLRTGPTLRSTLLPTEKDGAESFLARPRAFQSVLDLCEWEHLDHGANTHLCGEGQRFLRILGVAAIPAANRSTAKDDLSGQYAECSAASVRHDDHGAISPQS